ncbi:hypothetical protein D3C80_1496270 [compost metagenome]
MTSLATYIDLTPGRFIQIFLKIVILFQIGRMAFSTHPIPILRLIGPVQPIFMIDTLSFIHFIRHIKPFFFGIIPGKCQCLQLSFADRNQILLNWSKSKSIFYLIFFHFPVFPICRYKKSISLFVHSMSLTISKQFFIIKISHYRFRISNHHGFGVM